MKRLITILIILLLGSIIVEAQEPPTWLNLGNLSEAKEIRDILEIQKADTNILLACGIYHSSGHNRCGIWKSINGGQSWSRTTSTYELAAFLQLKYDSISQMIWSVRNNPLASLVYSNDYGETWINVDGPPNNPLIIGRTIEIVGNYLYFGGNTQLDPYSISLYRLNLSTMEWEFVMHYPECNAITRLKYYNDKLYIFARDKSNTAIQVFTYIP